MTTPPRTDPAQGCSYHCPMIPDHWSPDQVLAVAEFLQDLLDALWDRYEVRFAGLVQPLSTDPDRDPSHEPHDRSDPDDLGEDLPF
jgi:hypothetical protein